LYDGDCALCTGLARRFEGVLARRGFQLAPLQTPWVRARLGLAAGEPLTEMKLLNAAGQVFGGAEAVVKLAGQIWWARPLDVLARLSGGRRLLTSAYRRIAAQRHCLSGACQPRDRARGGWLPLLLLLAFALALREVLPAWAFMWAFALALFFGCKWLTWWRARAQFERAGLGRSLGFLLFWPGMNPREFFEPRAVLRPAMRAWAVALLKTLLGVGLTWGVVPLLTERAPALAGWVGMAGCALALHFGLFHLLALAWQRAGVNAQPIMFAPWRAESLSEFWGRRWNRAFHDLAHEFVFQPLRRRYGVRAATLAVFAVSGLIHEAVLSLPARAGYGLPTAYFLVQGLGLLLERSMAGRRLGCGTGWRGWLFTVVCTVGPVFWLFHPPFIQHVILPFLRVIGAN
jgi:alginate O-acetyltransferase complex protein AlgI